ncbi:hypothetical protein ABZ694_24630 [Streptomyces albidoflavus]|uniref:hypothetical protein n=1 Tax=Streptomyces albidoflavus TaxID=1886 RepID=UPI003408526F
MTSVDRLALEVARLRREVAEMRKGQRVAHGATVEDAAIEVRDDAGSLRAIVGQQGDGTTGIQVVNGPPPPEPTPPILTSVLGGVAASWDGLFANGAVIPLDWARIEVHAAADDAFEPGPATLVTTIETAQGATVIVPTETPVYVRLLARSTSGTPSIPSATAGPEGPAPVVSTELLDGIVTETKLAAEAVTAAKIKLGAVGADQLALGVGNLAPDPSFEGPRTVALIDGLPDWTLVTPGSDSPTALHVDCTAPATAWKNLELARLPVLPGERHYLALDYRVSADFDGAGAKVFFRYEDATGTVTGWGVADEPPVLGGPWTRVTAQVMAPPETVVAVLVVEASEVTVGEAWFDNVEVRTLIAGGMVAAGTITAAEIAALSVETGHLVAEAVSAEKIAAEAVTAEKIAALAVTTDKLDANSITVGKLAAGSVDATALAADAITGKVITGGEVNGATVTGGQLRTAASGQRITLNEANQNKVIIYNAAGTPIAEFSYRGLAIQGTSGAQVWLDPENTYPNLRLTNASRLNSAVINVVENTPNSANLGLNSGTFTGSGYTNMKWRTFMGEDFWASERIRDNQQAIIIGGRQYLDATSASFGYVDTTGATTEAFIRCTPGVIMPRARVNIQPITGDSNSSLFAQSGPGQTGNLLSLYNSTAGAYRMQVDLAGNTNIAGTLSAGNIATGTVTITPSAAHTPTSASVNFNVTGSTVRAYATAQTTVPGVRTPAGASGVTGVGVSSITNNSMLVWVNRENTVATNIHWMVIGS